MDTTPVCFMHIGKVGGQAITHELFKKFLPNQIFNASSEQMDEIDSSALEKYLLITGHWSYNHVEKLPSRRFLFSMVRDPIDRVVSNYWFLRTFEGSSNINDTNREMSLLAKKYKLEDFLEQDHPQVRRVIENHQTAFFADDWRITQKRSENSLLENAIKNLSFFDLIGIYEQYDLSMQSLCALLSWGPWPSEKKINVTPYRARLPELSSSIIKRIKSLNLLDVELYRIIQHKFNKDHAKIFRKLVLLNCKPSVSSQLVNLPFSTDVTYGLKFFAKGWHKPEETKEGIKVCWFGSDTNACIIIQADRRKPLVFESYIYGWANREILDNLSIIVDGKVCDLFSYHIIEESPNGPMATKKWLIEPSHIEDTTKLEIFFQVKPTSSIEWAEQNQLNNFKSIAIGAIKIDVYSDASSAIGNSVRSETLQEGIKKLHNEGARLSEIVAAYNIFTKLSEKYPEDPNIWFWKAEALAYQGRLAEAIEDLETCRRLFETNNQYKLDFHLEPRLFERLGEALMMNDKIDTAIPYLQKAISLKHPTTTDYYRLNSAEYILEGIEKLKKSPTKNQISRWPVLLTAFKDLDTLIDKDIIKGIKQEPLLSKKSRVVTFGSCFAQNIAHALNIYDVQANCLGFGELINSTFANRALMEMISKAGRLSFKQDVYDTLRAYFGTDLEPIRNYIKAADMLIFTLGVAPAFFNRETNQFHIASPNVNTLYLKKNNIFRTTTVNENVENLNYIIEVIRSINSKCRLVFTVSPVPLYATFEYNSAIIADCVSKSTLRIAIDMLIKNSPEILYWPAFEIVRWVGAYNGPMYGAEDGTSRHVSESAIAAIIRAFIITYGNKELQDKVKKTIINEGNYIEDISKLK